VFFILAAAVAHGPAGWAAGEAEAALVRGLGPEPDSLDPQLARGLAALNVLRDLYEGLVTLDAAGRVVPGWASSWQRSDNGRRYDFVLRPGAQWSDGQPLGAEDFARGLRFALTAANGAPFAGLLAPIRNADRVLSGQLPPARLGIEAANGRLTITLAAPAPWLLYVLAHPVSAPRRAGDETPSRRATSGAYRQREVRPQSAIVLERNPHHYAAADSAFDTVVWTVSEDPASELARYRSGAIDITETIPPGQFAWLKEHYPEDLRSAPYLGTYYLTYNLTRPPFKDNLALRSALSLAIDRDTLVRIVTGAGEIPAYTLVAPGLDDYPYPASSTALMSRAERLVLARTLYQQAGYSDERPLTVELRYNTSLQQRRIVSAIGAMWREYLGVVTRLHNEEWKVFVVNRRARRITEVVRGGWIADLPDALSFLEPFTAQSNSNDSGYADPEFEALLARAAASEDPAGRRLWLARSEHHLLAAQPIIPLYHYVSRHLVRPGIAGFVDNPLDLHLSRYLSRREAAPR